MKLSDAVRVARTVRVTDAKRFAQHVVPEVVRPARVIWNQAMGAVFLLFAALFFFYALRYYRAMSAGTSNMLGLGFSIFLGAVMLFFGINSFGKARRIARR